MKITILGGSGKLGRGLAARLSTSHEVMIASRDPSKGMAHADAAVWCDVAIVSAPYSGHQALLALVREPLRGKILIDATVPLDPANPSRIHTDSGLSAAEEAARMIPEANVFAAFQTISHRVLMQPEVPYDVLVAGGSSGKDAVFEMIRSMRLRPVHAGPLAVAGLIEGMTALLISINKQNKVKESSIRIVGVPAEGDAP